MKLYVFTSGALNLDKSIIQNGSSGKVQIPAEFYSIRHPKGDVLFDCGNNDKIIADPDYGGPFAKALDPGRSPDIAIDAQLAKINVKPSDIKYVMLGHFHVDHAGNKERSRTPSAGLRFRHVLHHARFLHVAQWHRRQHAGEIQNHRA